MVWKFTGDSPVYQQIVHLLQEAVLCGEFSPGDKIPSVRDLALEAKVNPNTMQHALHCLEEDGLLVTQSTNGRYVTQDAAVIAAVRRRRLELLTQTTVQKFKALGLSPSEAADWITNYDETRDDA